MRLIFFNCYDFEVGGNIKFSSTDSFLVFEKKEFDNNMLTKHTKFVYD
ncbi:hypothetical protein AAEX28_15990 [Lentisphaerota bacterium WC36G]|nr:hypothetical protein LJT99_02750 [Lentisphaerae bacterium WC36]